MSFYHWTYIYQAFLRKEIEAVNLAVMERLKSMNVAHVILKTLMWVLIVLFAGDFVMQTISYSFYAELRGIYLVTGQ